MSGSHRNLCSVDVCGNVTTDCGVQSITKRNRIIIYINGRQGSNGSNRLVMIERMRKKRAMSMDKK